MHVANPGDHVMVVTPVAAVSAWRTYVAELPTLHRLDVPHGVCKFLPAELARLGIVAWLPFDRSAPVSFPCVRHRVNIACLAHAIAFILGALVASSSCSHAGTNFAERASDPRQVVCRQHGDDIRGPGRPRFDVDRARSQIRVLIFGLMGGAMFAPFMYIIEDSAPLSRDNEGIGEVHRL